MDTMSKRTLILIIFLTLLTAFFVYLALSQRQPQKPTTVTSIAPTKKPIPAYTTLMLTPENLSLSSNSGSLDVVINTGNGSKTNVVTAVQLELQYDPKLLTNVTITPGTFIPNATALINSVDKTTGKITYALAISPTGNGLAGSGTIATIRFMSLLPKGGNTEMMLLPTTLVTATGVSESVLLKATGATISSPLTP